MNDTDFINKEMFLKCACFMRKCNVRKGKKKTGNVKEIQNIS